MGDMGDPPKSKRLFYLVGIGVLVCAGVSLRHGCRGLSSELESLPGETERERGGGFFSLPPRLHALLSVLIFGELIVPYV